MQRDLFSKKSKSGTILGKEGLDLLKIPFQSPQDALLRPQKLKYYLKSPSIVVFYVNTLDICHKLLHSIDKVSEFYKNKVEFFRVNVEDALELVEYFNIREFPSILSIYQNGTYHIIRHTLTMDGLMTRVREMLLHSSSEQDFKRDLIFKEC